MVGLDSLTCVTFSDILCYLSLHSHPPEILQVLIHFVHLRMDGIPRAMCFIHDLAAKLVIPSFYAKTKYSWYA
jgi:hypothetical protein